MFVRFLRWVFKTVGGCIAHISFEGQENLPPHGPYIMTANHLSIFDVPVVFGWLGGEDVTGWAAEKWEQHPIFGPLLRLGGGIFIQRGEVDRGALQSAVAWLKSGKIFGMAPEGTRTKTGGLARAKTGIAFLAHKTNVPIVPLGLIGTEKIAPAVKRLRRARVTVRIGKPFTLPPLDEINRTASLRANTNEVMCRIAALLPPEYRGIYADHPRLKELLTETPSSQLDPSETPSL
jgi:1-acyl-sn-glycerol-3-phosphate acyltransferase